MDYISDKVSSYIDNNKGLYSTNGFVTPSAIKDEFGCIFNYLYLKKCDNSKFTVGIFLDRDYRYLLTLLACMKAGITYVPLSRKLPIARVNQIVKVSEIDMVVSDIDSNFESNSVYIQDIIDLKLEAGNVSVSYDEKQPLYIMFTSGSTGTPKGVIIPRSAYESFLKWMDEYYDVNSSDKMLFITEFTFDISLVDVGLLVLNNMDFYFSKFNGNIIDVMQELEAFEINIMSTVPSNLTMLLSNKIINRFKIEPLKLLILSGSKITKKLYDLVLGFFPTTMFYNGYGPTEATIFISCKYFDGRFDFEGPNASVGHEVSDMNIILLGNDKKQVNKGSVGEVFVSGNQLMSGYINNPERTNDVLTTIDEVTYYSVGDLAYIKNDNLYIVGRVDDTLKTRGYRVNLSDIESYTYKLDYINESVIVAIEDENIENKLFLFVTLSNNVNKNTIFNDLKEILPDYQMPWDIIIRDEMPLNNSGKISKEDLIKTLYN